MSKLIRNRGPLKRGLVALAVGVAAIVATSAAHAALLMGQTVSFTYLYSDISTPYLGPDNYVVGAGVEIPNGICCGFEGSLDIGDTYIIADFHDAAGYGPAAFNGFRITDVNGTIDAFTSATINAITNMVGLDASRVTFDANNIWVNWQDLSFDADTVVMIDIGGATSVPEPTSLALLASALLAAGALRRKLG